MSAASGSHHHSERSSEDPGERNPTHNLATATDDRLMRRSSLVDRLRLEYLDASASAQKVSVDEKHAKDSTTSRLKQILEEPVLRTLFREFLRGNFCEENLSFWLDVQDFKRRFNTTSSAIASPSAIKGSPAPGASAMERHQQDLIAMAFVIYNSGSRLSKKECRIADDVACSLPRSCLELRAQHRS